MLNHTKSCSHSIHEISFANHARESKMATKKEEEVDFGTPPDFWFFGDGPYNPPSTENLRGPLIYVDFSEESKRDKDIIMMNIMESMKSLTNVDYSLYVFENPHESEFTGRTKYLADLAHLWMRIETMIQDVYAGKFVYLMGDFASKIEKAIHESRSTVTPRPTLPWFYKVAEGLCSPDVHLYLGKPRNIVAKVISDYYTKSLVVTNWEDFLEGPIDQDVVNVLNGMYSFLKIQHKESGKNKIIYDVLFKNPNRPQLCKAINMAPRIE